MAILFVPLMQLFSQSLYAASESADRITAIHLAKWQMERLKNLGFTEERLMVLGDTLYPAPSEKGLEMNGTLWRIQTDLVEKTDPLEVRVHVYRDGQMDKPIASLVTLFEDTIWEEVQPI